MTAIGLLITAIIATMCSGVAYDIIDYCIDQHKKKDYEKLYKYEDYIIGHMDYNGNMNKQIVYKVGGDFNGDIKGENVTVILMGNGNINGNIDTKNGEVFVHQGNINGNVKADKVLCPTNPTTEDEDQYICKSCYHYVQTPLNGSYCTESSALGKALPVGSRVCKSYDGTGETTNYKSDCAHFSNKSGMCHIFHVNTCAIEHNCPYKIKRDECKTDPINNNTTKHNPAKDVESPELPVHLSNYRKNTPEPKMSIIKW